MSRVSIEALLRLSVADRLAAIDILWESIAEEANAGPSRLPLSDAQRTLLHRRSEQFRENPERAISLDESLERIQRSLS